MTLEGFIESRRVAGRFELFGDVPILPSKKVICTDLLYRWHARQVDGNSRGFGQFRHTLAIGCPDYSAVRARSHLQLPWSWWIFLADPWIGARVIITNHATVCRVKENSPLNVSF